MPRIKLVHEIYLLNTFAASCRLLECQMQEEQRVHDERYQKLLEEVNKLKAEKEQQQKLLAQSLILPEDARIEASLKHEITRLTNENLVRPVVDCQCFRPPFSDSVISVTVQSCVGKKHVCLVLNKKKKKKKVGK